MPRYLAVDKASNPIAILEAESRSHADLYGLRNLSGYSRLRDAEGAVDATEGALRESFERLLGNPERAAIAAAGRHGQDPGPRVIQVPHQEANAGRGGVTSATTNTSTGGTTILREQGRPSVAGADAEAANRMLDAAFSRIGMSEAERHDAVDGRGDTR